MSTVGVASTLGEEVPSRAIQHVRGIATKKSRVINCLLRVRPNQKGAMITSHSNGHVTLNLEGYAIIPIEEYRPTELLFKLNDSEERGGVVYVERAN